MERAAGTTQRDFATMSIQLIQKYYAEVDKIIRYGGSRNESSLRKPFQDLLEQYARSKNLVLVAEVEIESKRGTRIRPDGVLKDALRQDWGFGRARTRKTILKRCQARNKKSGETRLKKSLFSQWESPVAFLKVKHELILAARQTHLGQTVS
jgi:hypothetical protein